jgi:hypothetical protein
VAPAQLSDGRVFGLRAHSRTRSTVQCTAIANDRMATEATTEVRARTDALGAPAVVAEDVRCLVAGYAGGLGAQPGSHSGNSGLNALVAQLEIKLELMASLRVVPRL